MSNNKAIIYSEFITAKGVLGTTPLSCYKFTVNHGFLGLIAFIKRLFHIRSKVCNKVVAEQHTDVNKCVCYFVIYNSFERGSTNQNQGPELSVL